MRPPRRDRSSQARICPGPCPCQMLGWSTAATRYSSVGNSAVSLGSREGSTSSPPPSPNNDSGFQVELSTMSRWPRRTPSALRKRSRYGRAASMRSKQGSPARMAVGAASGHAARSRSSCSGCESTMASAIGTPSCSSHSGERPKTGGVGGAVGIVEALSSGRPSRATSAENGVPASRRPGVPASRRPGARRPASGVRRPGVRRPASRRPASGVPVSRRPGVPAWRVSYCIRRRVRGAPTHLGVGGVGRPSWP